MHLVFVHGVPGVGKRTVAGELAKRTGFPFFNAHHLAVMIGPVFGFSTPAFNRLRDEIYDSVIERAAGAGLPGLIATCIFEPSVDLARFELHAGKAAVRGCSTIFGGLTCEPAELERRVTAADRTALGKWTDYAALQRTMDSGYFDFPEDLPGRAVVVDTTLLSPAETAREILRNLPAGGAAAASR